MPRGGKRTGAGRKPDPGKIRVISKAITLPPELWEWIDKQDGSRGSVIGKIIQKEIHREIDLAPSALLRSAILSGRARVRGV
jgi:hypothetical protein